LYLLEFSLVGKSFLADGSTIFSGRCLPDPDYFLLRFDHLSVYSPETPFRPGRNPPPNRREAAGHLMIVWSSERSASEKINERPVAQAALIACLLSGA
jgi:hypothetical protein